MCVHKRESNKSLNKLHNDMNKARAADRRGVVTGRSKEVRDNLLQGGLVKSPRAGRHAPAN